MKSENLKKLSVVSQGTVVIGWRKWFSESGTY